ncbi:MAG: OmpA family protein, partial [Flavobacteriales bacterium]|nr:OmpA family protein [Flavobacteriales bacterium]
EEEKRAEEAAIVAAEEAKIAEENKAEETAIATAEEAKIEEEKKAEEAALVATQNSAETQLTEDKIRETKILDLTAKASANDKIISDLESKLEETSDAAEIKVLIAKIEENKEENARIDEELVSLDTTVATTVTTALSSEELATLIEEKKAEVAATIATEEEAKLAAEQAKIEEERKTEEVAKLAAEQAVIEAERLAQEKIEAGQDSIAKAVEAEATASMSPADSVDIMVDNSRELPLIRKEIKLLQTSIDERMDELAELEMMLNNSETPEEVIHLIEEIDKRKSALSTVELKLEAVEQALEQIGKDSTEIALNTSVIDLNSQLQDKSSEIAALEKELENSMVPDQIVELIIIMDNKQLELEMLEQALSRAKAKEETQVLNLRTLVQNKEIELSSLKDKLAAAATEDEKAAIQSKIAVQQKELNKMRKELAETEFLASVDDKDGDGSPDNIDQCPDEAGPTNNKGCPLKLYLLGAKLDTLGFATQDKDGSFVFENMDKKESYLFVLDVFDVDAVQEVRVKFIDKNGNMQFISANKEGDSFFRYQYIPYTLHQVDGKGDTLLSVQEDNKGVFVFQKLNKGQSHLFVLQGEEVDLVDRVNIDFKSETGEVEHLTAIKKAGQEFEYDPSGTTASTETAKTETEGKDPIIPLFAGASDTTESGAVLSKGSSYLLNNILFEFDRSNIHEESFPELDKLVAMLRGKPGMRAEISGHTDHKGPASYNQLLSERRSSAVVTYLVNKGISANRLIIRGYGESRPIAPNTFPDGADNPQGREKNRRTEIRILE